MELRPPGFKGTVYRIFHGILLERDPPDRLAGKLHLRFHVGIPN